jgi:hypothetical protein
MKDLTRKFKLLTVVAALGTGVAGTAQAALDLTGASYVTYDDANSYALQVDGVIAGSTGPGSLYYVNSTPGAIKDLIVVATGAGGTGVTTNVAGMDDALSTPSGVSGSNYFSGIWNSTLAAFTTIAGSNPLFFFNNNQVNSGAATNQNLAVWAQVSLTGAGQDTLYLTFSNLASPYALFTEGGGGVFLGTAGGFSSGGIDATAASLPDPLAGTNQSTDYVLSGGAICLDASSTPVSCSSPTAVGQAINNNLGANQAAYALDAPTLDSFLAAWLLGGFSGYDAIHVELRFGCDPATIGTNGGTAGVGDCVGRDANNGYEQLFIGTSTTVVQTPEPGSLALVALGLISLGAIARRARSNRKITEEGSLA